MPPTRSPQLHVPLALLLLEGGQVAHDNLRETLKSSGLKPRHGLVLMRLSQSGATSQQDLLDVLDLDPSVLVGLLNDLESEGLLVRVRDAADRRRHIVDLSAQGAAAMNDMHAQIAAIEEKLFAGVSNQDREVLRRSLQSVCETQRASIDDTCL